MVSFGELRRLSLDWHVEISTVERLYALDWLLKGIFETKDLHDILALRGPAALGKVYFENYPTVTDADLTVEGGFEASHLEAKMEEAAIEASKVSGLRFSVRSIHATEVKFEFTGPLGRRSAAQPLLPLRLYPSQPRFKPIHRPLFHPFSEKFEIAVRAHTLEEMAGEGIARLSAKPRARDVFDLWFILKYGQSQLDEAATRAIAERIAFEKGLDVTSRLESSYRVLLGKAWDNGMKQLNMKPSLEEAEIEISERLARFGFGSSS